MSRLLIFIVWLLFSRSIDGQVNLQWAKGIGGNGNENAWSVATDAAGNVFSTGSFMGTADMDPGPGVLNMTSFGVFDIYITKYSPAGNLVWVKQIGNAGPQSEGVRDIAVDASGNVYITGLFYGMLDFDPGPGVFNITAPGTGHAAFVLKLDNNGNFVWAKSIGESSHGSSGYSITSAASGSIYVTGFFTGTTDLDPGPGVFNVTATNTEQDIFITRLDNSGNFLWGKAFYSSSGQFAFSVCIDAQENVYTTGSFSATTDFDPGPAVYNLAATSGSDAFVSKLDANGNFIWAKQFAGAGPGIGFGVVADHLNNLYITGEFAGPTDFDPGPGVFMLNDIGDIKSFVVKLTTNGDFVWTKSFDGTPGSTSQSRSIACDITGDVYTTGSFVNSIDFDPGPADYTLHSDSWASSYISKLKADGSFVFAIQISSANTYNIGYGIAVDAAKNIYACGQFTGTPDFDPGPGTYILTSSNNAPDSYVLKLGQCVQSTSETITVIACDSYTLNNQTYTTSGVYTQHLVNAQGCDSALTIHLQVSPVKRVNRIVSICEGEMYFAGGANQTATGEYIDTYTGSNGCDSIITTSLTVHQLPVPVLGADRDLCEGSVLQLTPGLFTSYEWQDHSTGPSFSVIGPGVYWVKVTNGNQCIATDTIEIKNVVVCRTGLYIPTAFTPNGDQLNDIFRPIVYGNVVSFEMKVYNRWGQLVFVSNDPYRGWDGRIKGKDSDMGVFVWMCRYQLQGNNAVSEKGTVTVIR